MASIDKTYTDSFKEYKELKDWAREKTIVFNKKQKVNVSDYIYDWEEEDFSSECPVMNTPTSVDAFLIQKCPLKFVQDRLKGVYDRKTFKELKNLQFPILLPEDYKQDRKITISKSKAPLYNKGITSHGWWWLQSNNSKWMFDNKNKVWINRDLHLPNNTNTSHHKTVKSLVRFLRSQYLPSGLEFRLIGRYVGEEFTIKIK